MRDSRAKGDREGIDRALKVLMPDSKGLGEFTADGNRYAEFRQTVKREKEKLTEREGELSTREQNLQRGLASMEQTVARLEPVEKLVQLAARDDDEGRQAFLTLVQKLSRKNLHETMKWELDKKLAKPTDPRVDALERRLREETELREKRERDDAEARQTEQQKQVIQRHLVYLDQELRKSSDARVVALVGTPEGMRAIFEAQRQHYDPKTGVTLTAEQAARYVLEQKQKELEPWQKVFGGGAPAASSGPPPEPAPADAPAPRAKPLTRAASASNGQGRRLSDTELFDKYERLARLPG